MFFHLEKKCANHVQFSSFRLKKMNADTTDKSQDKKSAKWTRTTVLIREDHLEKIKLLSWWENKSIKDIFDSMVEEYLSSKVQLDRLIAERDKNLNS